MQKKKHAMSGLLGRLVLHFEATERFKHDTHFVKNAAMERNIYKLIGIPMTCTNTVNIFVPPEIGVMSP